MNILVPDSWLREFLQTKATPKQIKECLSLCGPSVERISKINKEIVYDIEVTSNRPDMMSISGIAREAAVILPKFGIVAKFINDPYAIKLADLKITGHNLKLKVVTNHQLNPRWSSIIIDNVKVGPSPKWLQQKLSLAGIRSIDNVVDVTNYLMLAYGQPAHAFDYDQIKSKNGISQMTLRESKKGEKLTTLDGITHQLDGGDIVIENGQGRLIDLCGIMGGLNSSITDKTKTVILFTQTYNAVKIRKTMMQLSIRTQAGSLFEKNLDPELCLPVLLKGIELILETTKGNVASQILDLYPKPYQPYKVLCNRKKINTYIGTNLKDDEIASILNSLKFTNRISQDFVEVTVPSFRQDITIDVDIIEEIARIYGYHKITAKLPQTITDQYHLDPILHWEENIKIRLRDLGFTETYTYSMISENLMDLFGLDKNRAYKIINPLSSEWVYMRPHLLPGLLSIVKQNLNVKNNFKIFELGMVYLYRENNLPHEKPTLNVIWTGENFLEAKGLAQYLFNIFGIKFPSNQSNISKQNLSVYSNKFYSLEDFGSLGEIKSEFLQKMDIHIPITRLYLNFEKMVKSADTTKKYIPIPKYPAIIEELTFTLPPKTHIGKIMNSIYVVSKLIFQVEFIGHFQNNVSFKIHYLNPHKNLTTQDISPIRSDLISKIKTKFNANLKGTV